MSDIKVNLLTLNVCENYMDMLASAIQGIESKSNTAISNLRSAVSKKIVGTGELCDALESCRRASSNLGALAAEIKRQYSDAETAVLNREAYSPRSWTDSDGVINVILNRKNMGTNDDEKSGGDQHNLGSVDRSGTVSEVKTGDVFHTKLQRLINSAGKTIKGIGEMTKDGKFSFVGGMVGYSNAIYTFFTSDKTGKDFFDFLSKSGKGYVDIYNFIEYLSPDTTKVGLSKKYGRTFAWIGAASSGVDFISSIVQSARNDSSTAMHISDWTGTASKGTEFSKKTLEAATYSSKLLNAVKQADGTYKFTAATKVKASSAVKKASTVLSLTDVVLSTASTGFKSYDKYNEDGKIDLGEAAKIGIESSVSGLSKVVSGLTLGLVSFDDDACATVANGIETWAENLGEKVGRNVLNNPYLLNMYKKGGISSYASHVYSFAMLTGEKIGQGFQTIGKGIVHKLFNGK